MKRVLAVALVVVMLFACVTANADEEKTGSEKYKSDLTMMNLYYQMMPDDFDDGKVMYTYINFMMLINSQVNDLYYIAYATRERDKGKGIEDCIHFSKTCAELSKVMTDAYLDWQNGKLSRDKFLGVMMPIVDSIVNDK